MAWQYAAKAGFDLWSAFQQAQQFRDAAELQARQDEMNARIKEQEAYETERFGFEQAAAYQKNVREVVSAQRVQFAAQNVDVSYGTAAELQTEAQETGQLNTLDLINQARLAARGVRNESNQFLLAASARRRQGEINAAGAIMQGVGQAVSTGMSGYNRYGGK